jgi:hypothetical protein
LSKYPSVLFFFIDKKSPEMSRNQRCFIFPFEPSKEIVQSATLLQFGKDQWSELRR